MSPNALPLITVVIPLYNGAEFIERTLRSVMAQTYGNLEILVVDDGSTDDSAQLVKALAGQDDRIRLIPKPNGGVASARNLGIQRARGEWIGFVDADDIWDPTFIQKVVDRTVFCSDSVGVIYSWAQNINDRDQPIPGVHVAAITGNVYATLLCHNFLGNASATVIRRSCLDRVGGYDSGLRAAQAQGCEDWDLYLRLAESYDYAVIPELLVGYRKLENSMSGDGHTMARSQGIMLDKVRSRHPEIPDWYYGLSRSSFYLYLALQGQQYGQVEAMHYWRQQALLAHRWATVLRPSWYGSLRNPKHQTKPTKPTKPPIGLRFWATVWTKVILTQIIHYLLLCISKMIGLKRSPQP
ncbi:MAG: glycosyltransferase family 2 protein [Alkalinema sp. RU_4_3]|nr:glycosyltransferase family 2 protein [Alkalinema sp. RU_4_3]